MEKGEIVFRARYTKMKLFGGPIAHKVIEGYIEQNICFTRIEKEVNEQLFGDFTISAARPNARKKQSVFWRSKKLL